MREVLASTKFADAEFVCTAAAVGGEKVAAVAAEQRAVAKKRGKGAAAVEGGADGGGEEGEGGLPEPIGLDNLLGAIQRTLSIPE